MTRKYWLELGPALLVGVGIVVATAIAKLTAGSEGFVLAGPVLLALVLVVAAMLDSGLRGESPRPSATSLLMAGACLVAASIVAVRDPRLVMTLMPIIGASAWAALLRPHGRSRCATASDDGRLEVETCSRN